MTDDEAKLLLPAVEEFVEAVLDRDAALVEACMFFTDPKVLAVLLADLLVDARAEGSRAVNHGLWLELGRAREQIKELRGYLDGVASRGRKTA